MRTALDLGRDLVLALDQGGQSSRAVVFDARGAVVAQAARAVGERRDASDAERVEQDPEELVRSLLDAIDDVARTLGADTSRLRSAGLATQRSSCLAFDRTNGVALSPVLSWQDRRASAWLARFAADEPDIRRRTGLRLSPHYGASKLRWCLDHLDPVRLARENGTLVLAPLATFLVLRLLAERPLQVDPANASRTLLWNISTGDWDGELCARFGIPRECLPACVPTRHAYGALSVGQRAVPFRVLNGDQSAALFASGAPDPAALYVNLGTGGFAQRAVIGSAAGGPDVDGLLRSVVFGERERITSVLEGTINGAGSALAAVARDLDVATPFEGELERALTGIAHPPLFLNGVSGLAAPFWRPDFRSRFVGDGSAIAKLVAVLESIVFLVREIDDAMRAALPAQDRVIASGGLARSDGLCRRLANVLASPVTRSLDAEATARGLAWTLFDDVGLCFADPIAPTRFEPRAEADLAARFDRWRAAMHAQLAAG